MTAFPIIETIHCDVTEQIATNVISITDGQIYTNANLFKKGYRPAVDSALSVSRVGSSGQFIYFKRLVGTIKNDLTNYRQYVDSSQISDVESDDILLLKLKGIAIECIYQQDQLDGSPIEEIILLLLLYNKGFLNKLTYEQFNNRFLPQVRYLAATELLYVMYIGSVARNRMSKKLERLLSVMLLPIIFLIKQQPVNTLKENCIDNFFYLIPCLHQFRGHSWFPIQQIIVKFILPGSTRFGALPQPRLRH